MTALLRAGVIGTGFVGALHVEALRRIPAVEIGVVAASNDKQAAAAAGALGVPRSSGDWRTVVADPTLDVVHVCVPNDLHSDVAVAALEAGKHVVCEKPLAISLAEGLRVADAVARSGKIGVLCHNYRFYPMAAELRAMVRAGTLGAPHAVRGAYLQDWLLEETDTNWRIDVRRGGASRTIADIGTHWIDLAELVIGSRLEAVTAQLATVYPRRPNHGTRRTFAQEANQDGGDRMDGWSTVSTEDQASLLLRFEGGVQGSLVLSQVAAGHKNGLELSVDGNHASATWCQEQPNELWIGQRDGNITIQRSPNVVSPGVRPLTRLPAGHPEGWTDALRNLLAAAYDEIRGARTPDPELVPLPTFADGVRHLAFVEAALTSARRQTWVEVADILANASAAEDSRLTT